MTSTTEKVKTAVKELKKGKLIILSDDKKREHEGDLVGLASFVTAATVNEALSIARGVLAVPITKSRADEVGINIINSIYSNTIKVRICIVISN